MESECTNPIRHSVRYVVSVTCSLSICGALMVIFVYVCFKSLRNKLREIILNLSLMDLGVGCSNLIGNVVILASSNANGTCSAAQNDLYSNANLCVAQAFFSHYFTMSSILWIMSVAIYIYITLVATRYARYFSYPIYVFCYGLPLLVSLWLLLTHRLGYTPQNPSGLCGVISYDPKTRRHYLIASVISVNLWLYLTFVLVPVLCLAIHCYLHRKVRAHFCSLCLLCWNVTIGTVRCVYKPYSIWVVYKFGNCMFAIHVTSSWIHYLGGLKSMIKNSGHSNTY